MSTALRRGVVALLCLGALTFAGCAAMGEMMIKPARRSIGPPPHELQGVAVEIPTASGHVAGWFARGEPHAGVVLLMHGVRADRRDLLARALFLRTLGYGVLLIDLPAHGESTGDFITYGAHEAEAADAALAYLARAQPGERIGVIGVSLGAVSLVLAKSRSAPAAAVLESMFPTFEDATLNRFRLYLGPVGETVARSVMRHGEMRTGVSPDRLQPLRDIAALRAPVLIISGSEDRYTTPAEIERIFAAASGPKELWLIDGAAHVDLHAFAREPYEARVGAFLAKHLRAREVGGR